MSEYFIQLDTWSFRPCFRPCLFIALLRPFTGLFAVSGVFILSNHSGPSMGLFWPFYSLLFVRAIQGRTWPSIRRLIQAKIGVHVLRPFSASYTRFSRIGCISIARPFQALQRPLYGLQVYRPNFAY